MNMILLHNIVEGNKLPQFTVIEIPSYSNKPKYTKFKNFLENKVTQLTFWPTCDNELLGALLVENNCVYILPDKCIGCLLCISTQNKLAKILGPIADVLSKIIPGFSSLKSTIERTDIFNGAIVNLPMYPGNRKIRSLAEFTLSDETKHISLWGCSILKFISSDENGRIGKEIEILKAQNPRDGRLDVCVISGNQVIVMESKTDLDSLLSENRYRLQIPSYYTCCKEIIDEFNASSQNKKNLQIYLLIGGNETDLFPPNHPLCTSMTGSKANRFYSDLVKFNIRFISVNALWLIAIRSIINKRKICWDLLFDKIFDDQSVGLVTAGLIRRASKTTFDVIPIPSKILRSSETSFS